MALNIPLPSAPTNEGDLISSVRAQNMLRNELLQARMQELENKFYPEKTRAAIGHTNAQTNEINTLLPGRTKELDLKNQYYAPNILSEIALRNAQKSHYPFMNELSAANAENIRAETKFLPTKYNIQSRNSLASLLNSNTQKSNAFRHWIQTPEGQKIVQGRPDIAEAILKEVEQSAGVSITPDIKDNLQENISQKELNPLPENPSRADIVKDIQRGAADRYEKENLPADTKKRLYAGDRFKSAIPMVLQNFEKASIYFSASGQIKLAKDIKKAFEEKRVPPELQAYRKFEQGLEFMKVAGAFLEGVPADIPSRSAYGKIYDIKKFANNPIDAIDIVKNAINLALMADKSNRSSLSELKQPNSQTDSIIDKLMNDPSSDFEQKENKNTNNDSDKKIVKIVRDSNGKLVRSGS